MSGSTRVPHRPGGGALRHAAGVTIHVALLVAVGAMVVYLASRHRVRVDLTADGLFSLTDSTRRVLDRLDDRLRIEAWFSPDDELAPGNRENRETLREVLDEYVQQGRGKVVVQYFDPASSRELRETATRLGIQPQRVQSMDGRTLSSTEIWQGMRFLYGGDRQKVVPRIALTDRAGLYEAALTPLIKALSVTSRPKIGVIAWSALPPVGSGAREGAAGFDRILSMEDATDRYDLVPVVIDQGQRIPDDIATLLLFRPRGLTDRQKFVLDQFLMRGGRLAVFADTADVSLGRMRTMRTRPVEYDAPGAELRFLDQLAHYGIDVEERVVLDFQPTDVGFSFPVRRQVGDQTVTEYAGPLAYPYWFRPSAGDWAAAAERLATNAEGRVDPELAASYRRVLQPGFTAEAMQGLTAPEFFWPCPVGLTDPLPEGVEGEVLIRTSPFAARHDPLRVTDLNPIGDGRDVESAWREFQQRTLAFRQGERELARQYGLMARTRGRLPSFFAGRRAPPKPGADRPATPEADPLDEPIGTEPNADGGEPVGPGLDEVAGSDPGAAPPTEPPQLDRAADGAALIVVGDSDFVRDDLVSGEYAALGGPVSRFGRLFFVNLLDWLAEDRDLYELRGRSYTDRTVRFVDETESSTVDPARLAELRDERMFRARLTVSALPIGALLAIGVAVGVLRRRGKRRFLRELGAG